MGKLFFLLHRWLKGEEVIGMNVGDRLYETKPNEAMRGEKKNVGGKQLNTFAAQTAKHFRRSR